jgi:hypothetical protein
MDRLPLALNTHLFGYFDAGTMRRASMLSKSIRGPLLAFEERTVRAAALFAGEQGKSQLRDIKPIPYLFTYILAPPHLNHNLPRQP